MSLFTSPPFDLHPFAALLVYAVLVFGATARLTRFVTSDALGGWLIADRVERWGDFHERRGRAALRAWLEVESHEPPESLTLKQARRLVEARRRLEASDPITWQGRLAYGLECPFCFGFWVGALLFLGTWATAFTLLETAWIIALAVLGLNYIVGHVSSRLD